MKIALALIFCYLIGSIPFGLIIGKLLKNIDIRDLGSGNIGATNVLRTLGPSAAIVVFLLDTAKGLSAVLLCEALIPRGGWADNYIVVAGALLSLGGHMRSVFLRFNGGKGVATSLGIILGFSPIIGLTAFGIWIVLVGITRYVSVASVVASVSVPVMMQFWSGMQVPLAYELTSVVAVLAIVVKHIPNMKRLASGTESKIGQKIKINAKADSQNAEKPARD